MNFFGLMPWGNGFMPWQLITYQFVHADSGISSLTWYLGYGCLEWRLNMHGVQRNS